MKYFDHLRKQFEFNVLFVPTTTEDGKHRVEIILSDGRWTEEPRVPRPTLTFQLDRPYDPITCEGYPEMKEAFERMILKFAAIGVVASMERSIPKNPPRVDDSITPNPSKFDLSVPLFMEGSTESDDGFIKRVVEYLSSRDRLMKANPTEEE